VDEPLIQNADKGKHSEYLHKDNNTFSEIVLVDTSLVVVKLYFLRFQTEFPVWKIYTVGIIGRQQSINDQLLAK